MKPGAQPRFTFGGVMSGQIFISYARNDNVRPPGRDDLKGFVTFLDEQLRYQLMRLGDSGPKLWRDTRRIDAAEQFDPEIAKAIAASQLLLVILSRNWVTRPWCRRELELFCARWKTVDEARRHIVVAALNHVPSDQIPAPLQGQEGYRFFDLAQEDEAGQEQEFFARGRVADPRYDTRVDDLARYLWRALPRTASASATPASARVAQPSPDSANGRTVYVAKAAGDMRLAYDRLLKELTSAGYMVTPPPDVDIPYEDAATFIDQALATAEFSVHVLGERLGYAPDGEAPIVQLQLARAVDRAAAGGRFHRVLWAPRFLTQIEDTTVERDPLNVIARLDRQLDNDTVIGDNLSAFVEFLFQHLERTSAVAQLPAGLPGGALIYVYHRPEDEEYATNLALALRERHFNAVVPVFEGEPAEIENYHRDTLRECQAVVLCWAKSPEVWARATCREWRSWEKLGRSERFAVRGLVAGPPPGSRKWSLLRLPPQNEIDLILDLTEQAKPSPEALEPLIRAAAPHRN